MNRFITTIALLLAATPALLADVPESEIRFHCERDTARINRILEKTVRLDRKDAVEAIIAEFIGTPYKEGTLEGETELLTINIDEMDARTLVENVVAMSRSLNAAVPVWRNFADRLENVRYRKGEIWGYVSRLHYPSQWVGENVYRGNVKEITENLPGNQQTSKSLIYMTRHRDEYPALKDSSIYEGIRDMESTYRSHRYPYMRKESIGKKQVVEELRTGDIILLLSKDPDLDASHMGLIRIRNGKAYLIHASKEAGKVVEEKNPLDDFFRHEGRNYAGYRIIRIEE